MHQPIGLGAADECSFRPPGHIGVHSVRWDGRESSRLRFEIIRQSTRSTRRRCCVGLPISADFGCFSTPVSTAGGRRDPGALPMYRPGTAITSDRPLRPLGARHRSFSSASASFDLLYTKAKICICLKFALDLAATHMYPELNLIIVRILRFNSLGPPRCRGRVVTDSTIRTGRR